MFDSTQSPVDMDSPNGRKYEQFLVCVALTSKKAICCYLRLSAALDSIMLNKKVLMTIKKIE